jgi:hypothetical protein
MIAGMRRRKGKRGRPSLGRAGHNIVLAVKVSAAELDVWRRRAKAEGKPLSSWLLEPRRKELP